MATASAHDSAASGEPPSLHHDDDAAQPGSAAKKDKQCPFCHQAFTSSSLGRHLDLYIKDANPKPPDGIHNVDEIRKIRATITRRQPKGSKQRDRASLDGRNSSSAPPSAPVKQTSPVPQPSKTHVQPQSSISQGTGRPLPDIYKLQWTATGVINNIPNRAGDGVAGSSNTNTTPVDDTAYRNNTWDRAHPSDMALREVLREVSLAQARLKITKIFDFDFFSSTFPSLVLKLLKPPPPNFESLPYHVRDFWPRNGVPTRESYDNVRHRLTLKVQSAYDTLRKIENVGGAPNGHAHRAEDELKRFISHLDAVFAEWQNSRDRENAWQFAIMSEIRSEREARQQAEEKVEKLISENESLRNQINVGGHRRSTSNMPTLNAARELAPNHISDDIASELARAGIDLSCWTYDALVGKWKGILNSSAPSVSAPGAGWQPNTTPTSNGSPSLHNGHVGSYSSTNRPANSQGSKRPAEAPLGGRPAPYSRAIRFDDVDDDDEGDGGADTAGSETSPQSGSRSTG